MNGLETNIRKALANGEHRVQVVDSLAEAEIRVFLEERVAKGLAREIYEQKWGRTDSSVLRANDVKSGKTLVSHGVSSRMTDSDQIARAFVQRLLKQL